jgi:glycosyltransferase involved in cell wall biosynthesis
MPPLVSVVTPSFNQRRWLANNIRSVAAQSYSNVEQIVMDGASTDGSVDLLKMGGPRLRWWSEQDRGQSHAINKAFAAARGDIIGWLNSDDAYFSGSVVEHAVECFAAHPDVAVVYGHAALVNADGLVLQLIWTPPFQPWLLRHYNYIIQPAAFVRRSVLGATLVDEDYDYSMDRELWLRLAKTHRFMRLPRILAIDRHHPLRKAYTRPDLAANDRRRLARVYRVATSRPHRAGVKLLKIGVRWLGAGLVREVQEEPLAFGGFLDSRGRLLLRQLAALRAWMPKGST